MSEIDLTAVLRDAYGLTVTDQVELPGEVEQTSRVTVADGRSLVVKIAPSGTSPAAGTTEAALAWQLGALAQVAVRDPELPVPRALSTVEGQAWAAVDGRLVRVLTWLPGRIVAELEPCPRPLLREWGEVAGRMVRALAGYPTDGASGHHWIALDAPTAIASALPAVTDPAQRALVERALARFGERVEPVRDRLRTGVVHQDLNDYNVLAAADRSGVHHVSGIIDFGDLCATAVVAEAAVAVAYAMLGASDPLRAAADVVAGFHAASPLDETELSVIFPLAAARLCVNATTWTQRAGRYGAARMRRTWPCVRLLDQIAPERAEATLRAAVGLDPWPAGRAIATAGTHPAVREPLADLDLGVESELFDGPDNWTLEHAIATARGEHGPGLGDRALATRHLQPRLTETRFGAVDHPTVPLGIDLYLPEGELVFAPVDGIVESENPLVLRHDRFWSHWHGLAAPVAGTIAAGAPLGTVTGPVRVQLAVIEGPVPLFVAPPDAVAWSALSPDPSAFLSRPDPGPARWDVGRTVRTREAHLGRSQRSYYARPMHLRRGRGSWLVDENAQAYLDAINNVSHVGHANLAVTRAASRQLGRLNTNSRFVYAEMAQYAERLCQLLPEPLEVVFLVCSGSEANDLALRIARTVTGRQDVVVIDGAYHGNTTAVTRISPNRYHGPGGAGRPETTHEVRQPNRYRGPYGYDDPSAGTAYAADVAAVTNRLVAEGRPPAAFFAESLMGTAGSIVFPDGYLAAAFDAVRATGGLCVSDEVQVGFGRLGETFWGFERSGVVPDIVTMGKPIGNGHPLAAVVTTREIATAFDNGMKYFNTFGGNPVSCAVGLAVLDEIERGGLQQHARRVGDHFGAGLRELSARHQLIGDVRGLGLYFGIELVRDRTTKEAARDEAYLISEQLKDDGVIVYPTGSLDTTLKLKPPMPFGRTETDRFIDALDAVLSRPW